MNDIFEEYNKLMEERGLIEKQANSTWEEKKTSKDYKDAIMVLYGLDIETNDSKKSLIEQAHPETVYIAPAYDKINGIVENIQQRQDIMIEMVQKPTNPNYNNNKMAKKELLDELIKLGFDLDNEGEEELSSQATLCAMQLIEKKANPIAAAGGVALAVLGSPWFWRAVGAVVAWGTLKNNVFGYIDQGIKADTSRAIEALSQLSGTVSGMDKALIDRYILALHAFDKRTNKALEILGRNNIKTDSLSSATDVMQARTDIKGTQEEINLVKKYVEDCNTVINALGASNKPNTLISKIYTMKESSGEVESDWWQSIKSVWEMTFGGSGKSHAINSLGSLRDSISLFLSNYNTLMVEAHKEAQQKGQDAFDTFKEEQGTTESKPSDKENKPSDSNIDSYIQRA